MADRSQQLRPHHDDNDNNIVSQAINFARNVATGHHWLSRLIPTALWLLDALLCWVIIKKIPCKRDHTMIKSRHQDMHTHTDQDLSTRHRDRLDSLHGASPAGRGRREGVHPDQGRHGASGLPGCSCLDLPGPLLPHRPRQEHRARPGPFRRAVLGHVGYCHALLQECKGTSCFFSRSYLSKEPSV